jgi:ABC-type phosphate transport system substrate-binding protein
VKRTNAASVLALAIWLAPWSATADLPLRAQTADVLVMVANKSNTAASKMNKSEVKKLILGETTTWPGGEKVKVVMGGVGSVDRTAVLQRVCGMSEAEYTRHNLQASFMGETAAPVYQAASAAAVKNFVRANPGAVGFLHESEVDNSVKAVWSVQ